MRRFGDLLQGIVGNSKIFFNPSSKNGNIDVKNNKVANHMENNEIHLHLSDSKKFEELYETLLNKESSVSFKEKILPIEKQIADDKPFLAINEYEKLIKSDDFTNYNVDEKFLIYNGLLNCFINIEADEETINKWILKIESLGNDVKEIHRYYFLLAIWYYNKRELENAIIKSEECIKAKSDYMNGVALNILLKATHKVISYDEAKKQLSNLLGKESLRIKEKAILYASLGDLAYNYRDFPHAKENYIKSHKYSKSISKEIGIAICEYFEAIKSVKEEETITLDKIDYKQLNKSRERFEMIYNNRDADTLPTIARLAFSFMFNIYSLLGQLNKILEIKEDVNDYIDLNNPSILHHIVEAEVINGIYNEDTFRHLTDYEKVKYKSFYYEVKKDYESEIELLLDSIEERYEDDKTLKLSLLNALKESNQKERYIHYYKKFIKENHDEVLWMNYIQLLHKFEDKENVIREIKNLKQVVKNSFVLYDMLVILLDYNLTEELDKFFNMVDSKIYNIIEPQMPFVIFSKLMYLLKTKRYEEFFNFYENEELKNLSDIQKAILEINYYTFKGDYDKTAEAYYRLFKISNNFNDLIKAVELKLTSNLIYDAERYLELINPMMLDKPEMYYIFYAIVLKEKGELNQAFDMIFNIKDAEFIQNDLESRFHQFYSAFCMNHGKIDEALKYMGEYYTKNPNPRWFRVIEHPPVASGEEFRQKLQEIAGKRDLSEINGYFNKGIIGIGVYNHIVGQSIEEMILYNHFPFSTVHIAKGNVYETFEKEKIIENRILIDANTLAVLSIAGGLKLLDSFSQVLIPYSSIPIIKQRQSGITISASKDILEHMKNSLNFKEVAVDVRIKVKSEGDMLPEDTLDCIALAENFRVPFLNTEIHACREFESEYLIDINSFFRYLKNNYSFGELVALTISNLRKFSLEFVSFDANDIFICYQSNGLEGIKPFLKMGRNADYKTFISVYIGALKRIKDELSTDDFKQVSIEIVKFIDRYVGKTRHYMYIIASEFPMIATNFEKLMKECSIKRILSIKRVLSINSTYQIDKNIALEYIEVLESYEFNRIMSIAFAFVSFIMQYLNLFGCEQDSFIKYTDFVKKQLKINSAEDIDYIVYFINKFLEEKRDSQL